MKRILVLCAAVIVVMAAITGSIAYFTDEVVSGENVIVSGNLDVQQHEYEREKVAGSYTGKLQRFTQLQQLYPCVISDREATAEVVVDGHSVALPTGMHNYMDKIVNVSNTGNLQAYVRTVIAVPARNGDGRDIPWLHLVKNTDTNWVWDSVVEGVTIDGAAYNLHTATYQIVLAPGETTSPSLLGYYMDPQVSNSDDSLIYVDGGKKLDLGKAAEVAILVATQATQGHSEVFASAQEAMETTYGVVSAGNHPWLEAKVVTSQAELQTALDNAKYNDVLILKNGTYTLPAQLPNGVRLVGWGTEVCVAGGSVKAADVELDNLTFTGKLVFNGYGSFQHVVFEAGVEADLTAASGSVPWNTIFADCRMDNCTVEQNGNVVTFLHCEKLNGDALEPVVDGVPVTLTQAETS